MDQQYEVLQKQISEMANRVNNATQNQNQNQNQNQQSQQEYSMIGGSMLQIKAGANIVAIIIGAIFASVIAGIFNRFINLGSLGTVIAGLAGRHFFKTGFAHDFFTGVMIAGGITLLSGITSGLTGIVAGGNGSSGVNPLGGMTF